MGNCICVGRYWDGFHYFMDCMSRLNSIYRVFVLIPSVILQVRLSRLRAIDNGLSFVYVQWSYVHVPEHAGTEMV